MTPSEIDRFPFDSGSIRAWAREDRRHSNWPIVYVLDGTGPKNARPVYVGESTNAEKRFAQHLHARSGGKEALKSVRVVVDETFNRSVCHDLESRLIQLLSGDGSFTVLNRNDGIVDADYFDRAAYRTTFDEIFDRLRADGLFSRSVPEIVNSDLFKLSPFKALNDDQAAAMEDILEGLFADLASGSPTTMVVQGGPGTGKTIVGVYLMKLLKDIEASTGIDDAAPESMFGEFFAEGYPELLTGARIGMVVPQQSLRASVKGVFKRTPGLSESMVLTPFEVGRSTTRFDLLVVDEAHRLSQRANQPSGMQNKAFGDITTSLFGSDDHERTQLDWILDRSDHQIFLLDGAQSVRPADLSEAVLADLVRTAETSHRCYRLRSQMRVSATGDYVGFVRRLLATGAGADGAVPSPSFGDYDFRMFDDLGTMREAVLQQDDEHGLARLVAGFAWPWRSRRDPRAFDIELDGVQLSWNRTDKDWINSATSRYEVGSIHTVQGYDLNYAGVIIGPDLRYDPVHERLYADRDSYHDKKGKENVPRLGKGYTEDNLLRYIVNAYSVLLTRGMRGTYVYVCDPGLREYLRSAIRISAG